MVMPDDETEVEMDVVEIAEPEAPAAPPVPPPSPPLEITLSPPRRRAAKSMAVGLAVGVGLVVATGLFLSPIHGHTAGATVSGRIEKMEHRLDGLVPVDQAAPETQADASPEPAQP